MVKERKRIPINSEKDLQANALAILRRVNEDERGGLLFLLNPVFALEEAGFDLSPAMRRHIRRGLRYGAKTKTRIRKLEGEVAEVAGREVNVASDAQVARLLFDDLKLPVPTLGPPIEQQQQAPVEPVEYEPEVEADDEEGMETEKADHAAMTVRELRTHLQQRGLVRSGRKRELIARLEEADRRRRQRPAITLEVLEALRDEHPVVPRIIELRKLLQTGWRFVNHETYEKVKDGASVTLLRRVRFRRQRGGPAAPR